MYVHSSPRSRTVRAPHSGTRNDQKGIVITLVLLVLLTAAGTAVLRMAAAHSPLRRSDRITQEALAEARRALIGRAAADDDRPGSLPCPDTDNDGDADLWDKSGVHCPSYIGRLPWKTLGLPELRDGSGELLWYALSPSLRDHPSVQPINSVDTTAQIRVEGTEPAADVAAVIVAPGPALPGQNRNGSVGNVADYLEAQNASAGDNVYETGPASQAFNDRLLVITRDQLFDVVEWRVAREIREALRRYYGAFRFFPFAASYTDAAFACKPDLIRGRLPNADLAPLFPLSVCPGHADWQPSFSPRIAPPPWFAKNNWHLLTHYAVAPACTRPTLDCTGSGFLTVNERGGIRALVIVGGRAIAPLGQSRPCAAEHDCIEQPLAAANRYRFGPRSASFNDRLSVVAP